MNNHTPGPWSWWTSCSFRRLSATNAGDVLHAVIQRGDGHPDIHFPNGGCDGPDARLIAAAPELLDGLKFLYRAYVNTLEAGRDRIISLGGECDPVDQMEHCDPALIQIRALIAKATRDDHA